MYAWAAVLGVVLAGCRAGQPACAPADRMPVTRPDSAAGRYRTPVVRPDTTADPRIRRDVPPPCPGPAAGAGAAAGRGGGALRAPAPKPPPAPLTARLDVPGEVARGAPVPVRLALVNGGDTAVAFVVVANPNDVLDVTVRAEGGGLLWRRIWWPVAASGRTIVLAADLTPGAAEIPPKLSGMASSGAPLGAA